MMGNMAQNNQGNQQRKTNTGVTIKEFQALNPHALNSPNEPLEADDWTTDMHIALEIARITIVDWVLYATYSLHGDSAAWWRNFKANRAPGLVITWAEFSTTFKTHHIPEGHLERKREEFSSLIQGNNSVLGYSMKFTQLARYAGYEVNVDAKKKARFCGGLNPRLKYALDHVKSMTFEDLVNDAL